METKIANMRVSPVALGCMRIASLEIKAAENVIMTAVENGITYFDHADIYGGGNSEKVFGEVLRRNPELKDKIVIQDKCGICGGYYDASREHILQAVDGSLSRLGLEKIDVLLIHRPDALMEPEEVASAFDKLKRDGKVKYFGVSNMNPAQIELLSREMPGMISVDQLQFGLAHSILVDEGINVNMATNHSVIRTGGALDYCRLNSITIQAWSPLQYGMISGPFMTNEKYAPLVKKIREIGEKYSLGDTAVAVAWILRHPAAIQTIVGTMSCERICELSKAMDVTLDRRDWYTLYKTAGNPLP